MKYALLIFSLLSFEVFAKFNDVDLCKSLMDKTKILTHPREFGSNKNKKITDYLALELKKNNLMPRGDKKGSVFTQDFKLKDYDGKQRSGQNVIGIIGKGDPEVLIMAHFDSVTRFECHMCPGATDNATSVALMLSIIPELKKFAKAPIGIMFFNAEEIQKDDNSNGSKYFIKNPTFPLKKVKLVINLDILGTSAYKALENDYLALGTETGGKNLKNDVMGASVNKILRIRNFSYVFGHRRSDHTRFVKKGIPAVFFTDSDNMVYHTRWDTLNRVDFRKVREVAKLVTELTITASNPSKRYKFKKPKKFLTFHLPTYQDMYNFIFLLKDTELELSRWDYSSQKQLKKYLDRMMEIYQKGKKKISLKDRKEFGAMVINYLHETTYLPQGRSCL